MRNLAKTNTYINFSIAGLYTIAAISSNIWCKNNIDYADCQYEDYKDVCDCEKADEIRFNIVAVSGSTLNSSTVTFMI